MRTTQAARPVTVTFNACPELAEWVTANCPDSLLRYSEMSTDSICININSEEAANCLAGLHRITNNEDSPVFYDANRLLGCLRGGLRSLGYDNSGRPIVKGEGMF
jgi:hypothetical protein